MSKHIEKTRKVETKNFGEREFSYRVNQFETLQEVLDTFGGESELVSRMNGVFMRGAEAKGIRTITESDAATEADLATVFSKAATAILDYKPEATTGESKAAKVEKFDTLQALQSKIDFSKVPASVVMEYLSTNNSELLEPYMNA